MHLHKVVYHFSVSTFAKGDGEVVNRCSLWGIEHKGKVHQTNTYFVRWLTQALGLFL